MMGGGNFYVYIIGNVSVKIKLFLWFYFFDCYVLQSFICWFIASAQIFAVVQADWRLNPPVIASISIHSPTKKRFSTFLHRIVAKSISSLAIPPQVTNSPLWVERPMQRASKEKIFLKSVCSACLFRDENNVVFAIPEQSSKYDHSFCGRLKSGAFATCFFANFSRAWIIVFFRDSSLNCGAKFMVKGKS